MSNDDLFIQLNRAGIILNFVSAFFLTPEIIGLERLKKLELKIKNYAHKRSLKLEIYSNQLKTFIKKHRSSFKTTFLWFLLFTGVNYLIYADNLPYLSVFLGIITIFLIFGGLSIVLSTSSANSGISLFIVRMFWPYSLPFVAVRNMILYVYQLFLYLFVQAIYNTNDLVIRFLIKNEARQVIVIGIGVFLFFIGAVFQYIATY